MEQRVKHETRLWPEGRADMTKAEVIHMAESDEQAAREQEEIASALRSQSVKVQPTSRRLSAALFFRSQVADRMAQIHRYAAKSLRELAAQTETATEASL